MDKNKIILGVVVAALGLFLLISPDSFIQFFVIILGVAAIIDGIFILAATRHLIVDPQYSLIVTIRGSLSLVVGALSVALPMMIASVVWKAMAYTLAVYLVVSAGMQLFTVSKLHRNGIMIHRSMVEILSSVVLAVVLFVIPSQTAGHFIIRLLGIVILLSGAGIAFLEWKNRPLPVMPESVENIDGDDEETGAVSDFDKN